MSDYRKQVSTEEGCKSIFSWGNSQRKKEDAGKTCVLGFRFGNYSTMSNSFSFLFRVFSIFSSGAPFMPSRVSMLKLPTMFHMG